MSSTSEPEDADDPAKPDPASRREQRAAARARYRETHRDQLRAYRRAWLQTHREQHRGYERARVERVRRRAEQRRAAVERAKRWAEANPERAAANRRAWAAAHPDRVRASRRDYVQRNREAVNDRLAEWRAANPDKVAGYQRRLREDGIYRERSAARRADPEVRARDLASNRDHKRLLRRLASSGLPSPQLHKTPARERRTNEAAASGFFERRWTQSELAALRSPSSPEGPAPTFDELLTTWRELHSLRRRVEVRDRIASYIARHQARLYREAALDSRARVARGAEPLELDAEIARRARAAVTGIELPPITAAPPEGEEPAVDDVWVSAHVRDGIPISGHWRSARGRGAR